MPRLTQSVAFIIALLIMIFTMIGQQTVLSQQTEPTPECFVMDDGTVVCMSHAEATAIPSTPTPQPVSPLFPVVWFPVVVK